MDRKHKGIFISMEGGEGAGKSVQIKRLKDRLVERGLDVIILREPGGTRISELIREVLLDPDNVGMAITTEVLLFQAARAQLFREVVIPSLRGGRAVLMDRSRDSSTVYQGIVRGFGVESIEMLNDISTKTTYPDLTVLLDIPVEQGLERRCRSGKMDRLDMEKIEFHEKVRQGYLKLAHDDKKGRWFVVDATKTIDEVEKLVWEAVEKRLK